MTNSPVNAAPHSNQNAATATRNTASDARQIVLKEIGVKWDKFSHQDLSALKNTDDLVTQLVAKYGLEKTHAQRDADLLLKGRHI